MAISLAVTLPHFLYVRLHRRHGTPGLRILPAEQHAAWAQRLASVAPQLQGPIYFLWGTDWEDAPVVNARALAAALPRELVYDHTGAVAKAAATRPDTIAGLFARATAAALVKRAADEESEAATAVGGAGGSGLKRQQQPAMAGILAAVDASGGAESTAVAETASPATVTSTGAGGGGSGSAAKRMKKAAASRQTSIASFLHKPP
jgi:hypothetical protein